MPLPSVNADIYDEKGQSAPRPKERQNQSHRGRARCRQYGKTLTASSKLTMDDGQESTSQATTQYAIQTDTFLALRQIRRSPEVAGHRIGTVELESALVAHPAVSEAAVMGKEDAVKGEVPVAFVVLRSGFAPSDELRTELIKQIRTTIGPIATPDAIVFVNKMPKTQAAKSCVDY